MDNLDSELEVGHIANTELIILDSELEVGHIANTEWIIWIQMQNLVKKDKKLIRDYFIVHLLNILTNLSISAVPSLTESILMFSDVVILSTLCENGDRYEVESH